MSVGLLGLEPDYVYQADQLFVTLAKDELLTLLSHMIVVFFNDTPCKFSIDSKKALVVRTIREVVRTKHP